MDRSVALAIIDHGGLAPLPHGRIILPATLTAHERRISQILSDEYLFSIPEYQRPYAWTTEQAGELLEDLLGFIAEQTGEIAEMSPYFLGSIVLIKPEGAPEADVVDGQQRLTTLTMLLAALRANVSDKSAGDLTTLIYQEGRPILGTADRFRLVLRTRDRDFFREFVQKPEGFRKLIAEDMPLTDAQGRIKSVCAFYDDKVAALDAATREALAQFVVTRCFLVVVSTPDLDSAYRIFSVMNSRGLDLSAADILKAETIGSVVVNQRSTFTKKWEDIEEELGREDFTELFSQIRMVHRKAKPKGTLLKEFQEHVAKNVSAPELIDNVLIPYAEAYGEIRDAAYSGAGSQDDVNRYLRWLNRLEFADWLPPALAFWVKYRSVATGLLPFVRDLERLAYSLLLRRAGINERIERFSDVTREIEAGKDLSTSSSALQLASWEIDAVRAKLSGPIYETLPARARTTLLVRIDELLSGGGASYDYPVITVEHVLPQNPSSGSLWRKWFPNDDERARLTHSLGNLALLTRKKNSAASNYEFAKKKESYFAFGGVSPFPITTEVLSVAEWTPEVVNKRQAKLLKIVTEHWRL